MALKKTECFIRENLGIELPAGSLPPREITYNGLHLFLLGVSDKSDLVDVEQSFQYTYCSKFGDMYELYFKREQGVILLNSVRTRLTAK